MYRTYRLFLQFHSLVSLFYTTVLAQEPPTLPYAVACPAESKAQRATNDEDSMDHKALFIQDYYAKSAPWVNKVCKEEVKLAVVFHRKKHHIEFGYEVYFETEDSSEEDEYIYNYYRASHYSHYGPISEARSWLTRMYSGWVLRSVRPTIEYSSETKDMGFIWISRIILMYNSSNWTVVNSKYTLYRNVSQELMVKCNDHDLGNAFYEEKHGPFDNFYSPENQDKIFSLFELPELPENSVCKTTHECVSKYDFLMPYHFRSSLKSHVSCSNVATIPIWYEIVKPLLEKLEIFLFAMSQVTEKMLTILPGVSGTLEFMTKNAPKPKKPMPIYLYPEETKIPIPKIIYKIIRYKTHDCNTKKTVCWFDMVVVIHNHPGPIENQMICPQDVCKDYGWESIKSINESKEGQVSENIYCCQLDKKMQKLLDYNVGKELRDNLNMKAFPVYDTILQNNKTLDLQNGIEEKMKLLQIEMIQMSDTKL